MSMSNAQRQAAYRQRQLHDIDGRGERLNIVLDTTAKRTLGFRYAVTPFNVIWCVARPCGQRICPHHKGLSLPTFLMANRFTWAAKNVAK